jgi:threonine/homoserine/homoserine lactone efflux protein
MKTILRGLILGLSITAPIGPTNIEIIRRGVIEGWRAALKFCLGVMVALVIYLVFIVTGLNFLTESTFINTLLRVFGILVLAYLAFHSVKDFLSGSELSFDGQSQGNKHFIPGIILTIANPAILLLWTGIMGVDLASGRASKTQGLLLSMGIMIGIAVFFTGLTVLVHYGRRFLKQRYLRYVSLIAGIVLFIFCIRFVWDLAAQFM